jgi:exodeoxyribonuclease V alpha subunit
MMLQRNLLYTGVTRAKKLVVLAGSRRALAAAVRTRGAGRRHTALAHRLQPGGYPMS